MDRRRNASFALAMWLLLDVACYAARNQYFIIQNGKRLLGHSVAVTTSVSGLGCLAKCMDDPACLAVNLNPGTRECQLCDETPQRYGTQVELNGAWIMYHVRGPCDDGWIYFGVSCYWLVKSIATWSGSAAQCASLGARLLEIGDQQENDFVQAVIQSQGAVLTKKVWHGLNDIAVEQTFVWPSGAPVTFLNFGTNEGIYADEDCMCIASVGIWGDLGCGRLEHSMCEIELV